MKWYEISKNYHDDRLSWWQIDLVGRFYCTLTKRFPKQWHITMELRRNTDTIDVCWRIEDKKTETPQHNGHCDFIAVAHFACESLSIFNAFRWNGNELPCVAGVILNRTVDIWFQGTRTHNKKWLVSNGFGFLHHLWVFHNGLISTQFTFLPLDSAFSLPSSFKRPPQPTSSACHDINGEPLQ